MTTKITMIIVIKMEFKIVERYCSVTLTKPSQLCKAKEFFKKIR